MACSIWFKNNIITFLLIEEKYVVTQLLLKKTSIFCAVLIGTGGGGVFHPQFVFRLYEEVI